MQAAGPTVPAGAVVLATVEPTWPLAVDEGLVVTVGGDRLQVRAMGRVLVDDPLAGACTYTISGRGTGLPEYQGVTPDPLDPTVPDLTQLAGPDDAVLTVSRDGTELARATGPLLPSVDMLTTSATAVAPGALRVTLAVDDEFTSSPTFVKQVLIGLLVASLLATAALLARVDRGTERPPRPRRFGRPRIVDAVVPVVIGFWTLVAPATDDDGYYAAMARNARISGDVGNYYQLYDQNFTPFTWFYYVLGWWQGVVGDAPVLQRLLAVAFGLLTWVLLRRFAADAMAEVAPDRPGVRSACHVVLAAVFLAWWLPQDMGVRPEGVVCVCAVAAMHAVLVAWRRKRLAVAWLAFALAGLGFAAHPTGFTLLAPLLAGLPLLWRLVRASRRRGGHGAARARGGVGRHGRATAGVRRRRPARLPPRPADLPVDPASGELGHGDPALRLPAGPDPDGQLRQAGRGAAVPAEPRVVRGAGGGGADAAGAAAGGPVALGVDDGAGLRGAVAHAVEVDAPLRGARRRRHGVPRAVPRARGADGAQRAGHVAVAVRARRRRSGVVRAGDRAELARPQPVALRLAGRGAPAPPSPRRSSTCCSTRRCCGCSRWWSSWAGWWRRAGWSAPATRG